MSVNTCLIYRCLSSASAVIRSWFIYELQKSTTIAFSRNSLYTFYSRNPTCGITPCLRISNRKYPPCPQNSIIVNPPSPSEILKAVRGMVWIFSGIAHCHLYGPSLTQQLITCDKILFSYTQKWYQFLLLFFHIFRFYVMLCYFVIINFCPIVLHVLYLIVFSHKNQFNFLMFSNVPCSCFCCFFCCCFVVLFLCFFGGGKGGRIHFPWSYHAFATKTPKFLFLRIF